MSDLEGEDAFTIVVDRLIELAGSQHQLREQLDDAQGTVRDRDRQIGALQARVTQAEADGARIATLVAHLTDMRDGLKVGGLWTNAILPAEVRERIDKLINDSDEIPF